MVEAEDLCFPALCFLKAVTSKCIVYVDVHVYQLTEGKAPLTDVLYTFAKWLHWLPVYLSWGISFAFWFVKMPCLMGATAQEGCISSADMLFQCTPQCNGGLLGPAKFKGKT